MILQSQSPRRRDSTLRVWGDEVLLPGGFHAADRLERVARLRPITGLLERRLGDVATNGLSRLDKVSAILAISVERIGPVPCDERVAAELCVADRRYLMLALAGRTAGDDVWLTPKCAGCSSPFDVRISLAELPLKVAGEGFPFLDVDVSGVRARFRFATADDQIHISQVPAESAHLELLKRCVVSTGDGRDASDFVANLTPAQVTVVDEALDDAAPDVGTLLDAVCPECGERQVLALDPYDLQLFTFGDLDEEVHTLACTYHWSELEILSLPRERRHTYLGLIERGRGRYS